MEKYTELIGFAMFNYVRTNPARLFARKSSKPVYEYRNSIVPSVGIWSIISDGFGIVYITIQPSKSYYISRGRVIHTSLTKRVVKVLHKPISRPFCNRNKELLSFYSKRVVKVPHKSISLPALQNV
jgi:hypothetical protein